MNNSRKKQIIFAVCLVLIGAASLFFLSVASRTGAPAAAGTSMQEPSPGVENPDHELKALAVGLEKKPGHPPILMRMAQIERDKGELDDAARHLRQALQTEPDNFEARLELGRILYDKGDIGAAITETEKILASDPKQVDALYNMGAIYANLGNNDRARSYWMRAVQSGGDADSGRKAREALAKLGGS